MAPTLMAVPSGLVSNHSSAKQSSEFGVKNTLHQAVQIFRQSVKGLNTCRAIGVLDEDLLHTTQQEQLVRTIGQLYTEAPPIPIPGLPWRNGKYDDVPNDGEQESGVPSSSSRVSPKRKPGKTGRGVEQDDVGSAKPALQTQE